MRGGGESKRLKLCRVWDGKENEAVRPGRGFERDGSARLALAAANPKTFRAQSACHR